MSYLLGLLTPAAPLHLVLCFAAVFFVVALNLTWYYHDRKHEPVRRWAQTRVPHASDCGHWVGEDCDCVTGGGR
jgi:hypothetical protein